MTCQLVFNYLIPRIGNGFQTRVPNLKNDNLILQQIEFNLDKKDRPELEVTIKHGGTSLQYHVGYFQFFDRINLSNYWYRLADADEVELTIKNKSNKQQEIQVTYTYAESSGIIIHSSSLRAGDFKESTLLTDLTNGWIPQKIYLRSNSLIRSIKLIPKFKIINHLEIETEDTESCEAGPALRASQSELQSSGPALRASQSELQSSGPLSATYHQSDIDQNEVLLNFAEEELAEYLPMLGYYQLEVDFADPDQMLHLLAYGFKR